MDGIDRLFGRYNWLLDEVEERLKYGRGCCWILIEALLQLKFCHDFISHGCSTYDEILRRLK